jgi:hypothetical protein
MYNIEVKDIKLCFEKFAENPWKIIGEKATVVVPSLFR